MLTSPSAASRASSSVAIAPDQDGKKERKRKKKKETKKEWEGERGRQRPLNIKVLWVLEKLVVFIPTFPLSDVFSIAEQRLGKQRQTDSALDSELVLA